MTYRCGEAAGVCRAQVGKCKVTAGSARVDLARRIQQRLSRNSTSFARRQMHRRARQPRLSRRCCPSRARSSRRILRSRHQHPQPQRSPTADQVRTSRTFRSNSMPPRPKENVSILSPPSAVSCERALAHPKFAPVFNNRSGTIRDRPRSSPPRLGSGSSGSRLPSRSS